VTPDVPFSLTLPEGGRTVDQPVGMASLHGAVMAPMTVAFLAGILGMFVMLSSREADRRLVNAGYPSFLLLLVRLSIVAIISVFITGLAVGITTIDFMPGQLALFSLINFVSALQYAFIGAVVGTFLSAMSGTYVMFFMPMIDIGFVQNPMLARGEAAWWVKILPGYTPMEVLMDVSFTPGFDTGAELALALVYLLGLAAVAAALFWRLTGRVRLQAPATGLP
ncbi:hypothetical protein LCGC14_1863070, partial [marine sediment metagenome]